MSHPERGACPGSAFPAVLLHRGGLDAVIGVKPYQILDLLAQRGELGFPKSGVFAGIDDLAQCPLHRMERRAEQDLSVDAAAIAHRLEFAERQDRPPVAVAAA